MEKQVEFNTWAFSERETLFRMARSILKDSGTADDLVQETLLSVWLKHEAGVVRELSPYARRAVWLGALRKRSRQNPHRVLSLDEEVLHCQGASVTAGHHHEAPLASWELERAIGNLPLAQQGVLRLRFYGGLSFQEIGKALRISLNTAASRCRYALEAIHKSLSHQNPNKEKHHG